MFTNHEPIMLLKTLKLSLIALFSLLLIGQSQADEYAGKQWPASQQVSIDQVDHQVWNEMLQKYVDQDGMVNYQAWNNDATDRQRLKQYLESLSQANPNLAANRETKLAYWINAYNALTVEGILRVYPTTSIRKHTKKIGYNLWKNLYLYTGDAVINLDSIEHQVLRKMQEPRIHFAIVCASISCPRLMNEAYTSDQLENQLATNTKDFFSRSRNLQVDAASKKLKLSAIMDWFGSDFGDSAQTQFAAVYPYFPEAAKTQLAAGGFSIAHLDYDWGLNVQQ